MNLPDRFAAWLTINRACNLRCKWCYASTTSFSEKENMNLEVINKSISFLKTLPLKSVILIGGEPTIHPNFFKILEIIGKKDLIPLLVTNGIKLANKNFVEKCKEKNMGTISLSLKAASEEDYLEFTGKKSLKSILIGIKNLNQLGMNYKISVTACKPLFNKFEQIIDLCVKSNAKFLSVDLERPIIVGNATQATNMATPKELAAFVQHVYPKVLKSKIPFNVKMLLPFCLFPEKFIEEMIHNNHLSSGCQIHTGRGIIVDSKGRLLVCNHLCNNPIGKIGVDFSNRKEYYKFRRREGISKLYKIFSHCPDKRCLNCKYWSICGAGCRIRWLHEGADNLIQKGGENHGSA